ncbi:translocation/assembly module TamB domain-containing protein [Mariniblastus fucicola]|uniref:AsmA family protein n=1 Tax=Mariniblastus fucicola TaxID=980251 RepID=A0A5B9PCB4_9BACT|nr:AsmA-like C-terminal region-containing protein [Mariniblastus fucicola]QEG23129.1 AsmA family protein [Mariniblastus fucicola]
MESDEPEQKPKKRKLKRKILLVLLLVFVVLAAIGWSQVNSIAKSKLESQLIDAGFDSPKVGSVRVTLGGITANDVQLHVDDGVDLSFRQLAVNQSIFELARGVTPMDSVVLSGSEISLNSRDLKNDSSFSLADIDLQKIDLPASTIRLEDFQVRYFDDDGELRAQIVEATINDNAGKFQINGTAKVLDGQIAFSGEAEKSTGELSLDVQGQQLHLVDQQWQKWPGIGTSVANNLGADTVFDLDGKASGTFDDIHYSADIDTRNARIFIPKFELPIAIRSADVRISDGLVTYNSVVAAMGDADIVNGRGSTSIDGLPCRSKFEGDFTDVNVADLRKLVKDIPLSVVGTADGVVTGSVDVDESLSTTLRISANGDTKTASYGQIHANRGNVDVQIQPLVLTKDGKVVDLQGSVVVKAATKSQDVDEVLATFDLQELDRQFEFEMAGDGNVDLTIPLKSAADLRTWNLTVETVSETGNVSGMELRDLKLTASLVDGLLIFDPTTASLASEPAAKVDVNVKWPIAKKDGVLIADTGFVEVKGANVPPDEAIRFFNRQMKNAGVEYSLEPQIQSLGNSDIAGALNFSSAISLPSGIDRPIESWEVTAKLSDSKLGFEGTNLEQLSSELKIHDGILSVNGLKGQVIGGGGIEAGATLDLATSEAQNVTMTAEQFPASWLANMIIKMDAEGTFTDRTGLQPKNVTESLDGFFDAKIELDPTHDGDVLWNANAAELSVFGKPFTEIVASGNYQSVFSIRKLAAKLPGGGNAAMQGNWNAVEDTGEMKLLWEDASLEDLLDKLLSLPPSFSSTSDGELQVTFENGQPKFTGQVDLIEPRAMGGTLADHRFRIETIDNRIHFEDVETKTKDGLTVKGSFATQRPFAFDLKGRTHFMPLSTAIYDRLSGSVSSTFTLSGEAAPWKLKTSGNAKLQNLAFEQTTLSDITAKWEVDTERSIQQLNFDGLGGRARLGAKNGSPDDLIFSVDDLELAQFAAFRKLPVSLAGVVSGEAVIRDWQSPENRSIDATATSQAIKVGGVRLSRIKGTVSLSKGGRKLAYGLDSEWLDGKLEGDGSVRLDNVDNPFNAAFPLKLRLTNARLRSLSESSPALSRSALRQLEGRLSLAMDWSVTPGEYPSGTGSVTLEDAKWKNRLVSRKIYSDIGLDEGIMQLENISADLQQGEIAGRATVPLVGGASGKYELDVRNFSLERLMAVLLDDPIEATGQVNARISGRTGKTITGAGTLGLSRAGLFGVSDQSMKIPIRFSVQPSQQTATIEMPRTRFRAFRGNVNGKAKLDIGSRVRLESKLELADIDSKTLISALTGYTNTGDGKLSGRLEVSGKDIRSENDLVGTFRGQLEQSSAFSLPLLDQVSRFIGNAGSLRNDKFDSDAIDLVLSKGRVNVRQFRLQSSLASVVVLGDVFLDGRLDMEIAARVERLNQPTLLDELAGSPIARFTGPEVAFLAQAAEFLSERIVVLDVGGTTLRPHIRLSTAKQLKEEVIRYFLRGSQILPNANGLNN